LKTLENNIPKYVSSFELEEARLGQALQHTQLELKSMLSILEDPNFLKAVLLKIKDENINAEWALAQLTDEKDALDLKKKLLEYLLKKNKAFF